MSAGVAALLSRVLHGYAGRTSGRYRESSDNLLRANQGFLETSNGESLRFDRADSRRRRVSEYLIIVTAASIGTAAVLDDREARDFFANLPPEAAALIELSPLLQERMGEILNNGWSIEFGQMAEGIGGATYPERKTIVLDLNSIEFPKRLVSDLAHEVSHAHEGISSLEPPTEGMTKQEWVEDALLQRFLDEAEAEIFRFDVIHEIADNDNDSPVSPYILYDIGLVDRHAYYSGASYVNADGSPPTREEMRSRIAESMYGGKWDSHYRPDVTEYWNENFND
ncbi:hypothetical protein [Nocardia testacea]|uniref:hypothetical protein n=1 Tax=Nocardia testacea TaxID=248551 RepID=UPI0012F67881|nr:hypothetical protein [Nocardia testacea]